MEFISPGLDIALAGLLGLLIGSFLNVVIHRMPKMMERQWWTGTADLLRDSESFQRVTGRQLPTDVTNSAEVLAGLLAAVPELSLAKPASRCGSCGAPIRWYQNIPILSFMVLRGKCGTCRKSISWCYPALEFATGLCFAAITYRWGIGWTAVCWAFFTAVLITQFFIDFDTQYLPDDLNFLLMWVGLVVAAIGGITIPLTSAVWGAALGYLSLWGVFHAYRLLTGKEGMGYGDFKLLAALGAWFGADYLIAIILMSSVVGAILGGLLLGFGKLANKNIPIAFGPFLCGAGFLVLAIGPLRFRDTVPFVFPFQ